MKVSFAAFAAFALLLALGCSQSKPIPVPAPPAITSFAAEKTVISEGQSVKLTFSTRNAKEVSLIDQTGAEVPVTGSVEAGEATVSPSQTAFYVLRATGEGGKDSAFVQVAVNEGLRQVFLIAVPTEISSGDPVELVWSALGGKNVSLKDSNADTLSMEASGTVGVHPQKTTTWTLRAQGPAGMLSATARVKVRPVIKQFTAAPPAARQGNKIKLAWQTAGADSVVVKEATFGELVSTGVDVDTGSFEFTVPFETAADAGTSDAGTADAGRPVPDNFPLRFTLTATSNSPMQAVSAALNSVVRDGPIINVLDVPDSVTENQPFTLTWDVSATRTEVLLDGVQVYATTPPASASGTLKLPGIAANTQLTLIAYDSLELQSSQSKTINVLKPPKVLTFTLPQTVAKGGDAAAVSWTTKDASLVLVRIKRGPPVFSTSAAAQLAAGSATLYPARLTTYVLEAWNAAGQHDSLEQTVSVGTPVTAGAIPSPTPPAAMVQLSWDVSSLMPSEVIGIPSEAVEVTGMSANFVDLEQSPQAHKLYFADRSEGTADFSVPQGYGFTFITRSINSFSAGVNGFLALAPTSSSLQLNVDLKGTNGLPKVPLLAPFWDNLDLGANGEVYWQLDGTAFPRRLIVQWNKVNVGGDPLSALTFEVQLLESGEFHFVYKTLQDANNQALGQSATIGVFAGLGVFAGQHSYNMGTLVEGQELSWFNQSHGASTGAAAINVGTSSVTPGFFCKLASGAYVYVGIPVLVFAQGSVLVNETMPQPNAGAAMGQYVELFNPQPLELELSGLQLMGTVTPTAFTIPPGTMIPANGYLVLGQSIDPAQNGESGATLSYGGDLVFGAASDGVRLVIGGASPFELSKLSWSSSTASTSVQREAALGSLSCMRTRMFGSLQSIGTPGKLNESCFEYSLEQIPVAFEDFSTGTPLLPLGWDEDLGDVVLPKPFKYFGTSKSTLKVSSNGWLSFGAVSSAELDNRVAPANSDPVGAIAPFWDDLAENSLFGTSNVFAARSGDHHVVQWSHASSYDTLSDDLNFEVKLFDNGVIEFHYAGLSSSAGWETGVGATEWLENLTGTAALPIGTDQPVLKPNTAYRFTPKP
jgi:hypothetical protein